MREVPNGVDSRGDAVRNYYHVFLDSSLASLKCFSGSGRTLTSFK